MWCLRLALRGSVEADRLNALLNAQLVLPIHTFHSSGAVHMRAAAEHQIRSLTRTICYNVTYT
ncbi:protein of unknown function [Methylorubrum extorquens]|uniref:Uncharacterized protein n=1 Tax=Methylorubrum extorquens TaxID=408 RepID=A0A2N9AN69_METEX|nr:protein of unknown function [Methylorubrum extorquens]